MKMGVVRGHRSDKTTLIIGAGLVGAHYAKRILITGADVVATVRDLESEHALFERRVFGETNPEQQQTSFVGKPAIYYQIDEKNVLLTTVDLFEESIDPILHASGSSVDTVVNAVNLGTLFGLRALNGQVSEQDVFQFTYNYHTALREYARQSRRSLHHLLVSTTGSGGIGLERMKISHNRAECGIPPSIIMKAKYAAEIRSYLRDFQRSGDGSVVHHAIVPASAIIDVQVYEGPVETYGDYRRLHETRFMKALSPSIEKNGRQVQKASEQGQLDARFGLFGEDGPHTTADLQQLQIFMGVTTATKIAEIIGNIIERRGAYNYDVFHCGTDIPEQSEYAVHSFERQFSKKKSGLYMPVTLSPIAPFSIPLFCFAYEGLADVGLQNVDELIRCSRNDETLQSLAQKIQSVLEEQPERAVAASSLGVSYDLKTSHGRYKATSPIERGVITNDTLREALETAESFDAARKRSPKLAEFMAAYETETGLQTKDVLGYLAAFPVASQMKKEGHF